MTEQSQNTADQNQEPRVQERPRRVLEAQQVLGGENEVWIEHCGVLYRLRLTRRGRLILTK